MVTGVHHPRKKRHPTLSAQTGIHGHIFLRPPDAYDRMRPHRPSVKEWAPCYASSHTPRIQICHLSQTTRVTLLDTMQPPVLTSPSAHRRLTASGATRLVAVEDEEGFDEVVEEQVRVLGEEHLDQRALREVGHNPVGRAACPRTRGGGRTGGGVAGRLGTVSPWGGPTQVRRGNRLLAMKKMGWDEDTPPCDRCDSGRSQAGLYGNGRKGGG